MASWLLPRLTPDHFSLTGPNEAFRRILAIVRKDGDIPIWEDLLDDPALSQDARDELADSGAAIVKDRTVCKRVVAKLDKYRRLRMLFNASQHIAKAVKADKVDIDDLNEQVGDYLFRARSSSDLQQCMLHVGDNKLDLKFVKKLLIGREQEFIPTGFKAFDRRNQGIPRGSLWLIAGTTGGGKTVLAVTVALYQASIGARVAVVSLEMKREHMIRRMLSALTNIPLTEINNARSLTNEKRRFIIETWVKFHRRVKQNGGRLTVLAPDEDLSMEDVLTLLKPYDYDTIFIDYVGLLRGMDAEDQPRRLGSATRVAARFAATSDNVVAVLAQLSEDGLVRYSRTMGEHAAVAWKWVYNPNDEASRESRIITIKPFKARQLEMFDFYLQEDFAHMRVTDLDTEHMQAMSSRKHKTSKGGRPSSRRKPDSESSDEVTFQL